MAGKAGSGYLYLENENSLVIEFLLFLSENLLRLSDNYYIQ